MDIPNTDSVNYAFASAQSQAMQYRHEFITPEHLLSALLEQVPFQKALAECFCTPEELSQSISEYLSKKVERVPQEIEYELEISGQLSELLQYAYMTISHSSAEEMDVPHLVQGMLQLEDSWAGYLLKETVGEDMPEFLSSLISNYEHMNQFQEETSSEQEKSEPWRNYVTCLNEGLQDRNPLIGRNVELERTIQVLCRKEKNNPLHVGEPGVGKTALVYGLAARIEAGNVPERLTGCRIYELDLGNLLAGTQYRGEFEKRLKAIMEGIRKEGHAIVYIDEIHNLIGAGRTGDGSMDASNMLKPYLEGGEIRFIGSTTYEEFNRYFSRSRGLVRRFQQIDIQEPGIEETIHIVEGLKERYETFHGVVYEEGVIAYAVTAAARYISDRFLPDKAIDLLDEACACCNLAHPVISEYLTMQKELEALKQEEADMENADVNEPIDYERVAERKTRMAQLERELPAKQAAAGEIQVTMDDVAKVIELWTGIPAVKIRETEYAKLASLETELKKKIIGQDDAVHLVAQAVKRSRADLSGRRRPASFIFVGPTGVGKTELVKQLANQLFDGPDPLIRLDMSEYMEKYAVSRMIGSPPGYVGYEEAGQLTEKVRRRPYSVVLFDEIEKAHPDVMNILLQILDEGKINDAQGRTVDFSNTVICMTSNAGSSDQTTASLGFNRSEEERNEEKSRKALSQFLRPEFLGRVDEVITFKPLSEETLQGIAALMLDEYKPSMEAKGIAYSYTPAALAALVHKSQGGKFGARDLRRTIRKAVEDPAAEKIIDGTLVSGSTLTVDAENDEIVLK